MYCIALHGIPSTDTIASNLYYLFIDYNATFGFCATVTIRQAPLFRTDIKINCVKYYPLRAII